MSLHSWPIIGHEQAVTRLARSVRENEIAHAYLFSGPAQVGKQTLGHTLAQALLCQAEGSRPCGTCRACKLVASDRHPDLVTLDLAWQASALAQKSSAQSISVDAVRQMNSELARRPHEGRWKVLLVPDVEQLTTAAANAFLKTLEEPPPFVVILLTTRDLDLVLPTIRSRCQPVHLFPLPVEEVAHALQVRWGVEAGRARLLARLSGGAIGWAIRAAQEPALLVARDEALATLAQALAGNRAQRLVLAGPLGKANDPAVLHLWASWWRDVLLVQSGAQAALTNVDQQAALEEAAAHYRPAQVRAFLRELMRLLRLLQVTNANATLVWEVLLLKLPHAA